MTCMFVLCACIARLIYVYVVFLYRCFIILFVLQFAPPVSKLTGATEAWYGYWGSDQDNVKYYEIRFYPDHTIAVNEGTSFAENVTGKDAKLNRKEAMWRVGLSDRRVLKAPKINLRTGEEVAPKYFEYMIYSNFILLCQGWDTEESINLVMDEINKAT